VDWIIKSALRLSAEPFNICNKVQESVPREARSTLELRNKYLRQVKESDYNYYCPTGPTCKEFQMELLLEKELRSR
jgi:hypothetical protein